MSAASTACAAPARSWSTGRAVRSCTRYAVQMDGADIMTVEGLADPGTLNVLQQRLRPSITRCNAASARPAFCCRRRISCAKNTAPSEAEVRDMLSGHICRCTGYAGIVAAIMDAAANVAQRV